MGASQEMLTFQWEMPGSHAESNLETKQAAEKQQQSNF